MEDFGLVERAVVFLLDKSYPDGCSNNEKRSIRRKAKKLVSRSGEVYYLKSKTDRNGKKVRLSSS